MELISNSNDLDENTNFSKLFKLSSINTYVDILSSDILSGIDDIILKTIKEKYGDKCNTLGFIDKKSIKLIKRSIGTINSSFLNGSIRYNVIYSANICNPIDGTIINCKILNINKMGILAEAAPLSIVLARQHHIGNKEFDNISIGENHLIKIIGKRFELYDDQITIIAELVDLDNN